MAGNIEDAETGDEYRGSGVRKGRGTATGQHPGAIEIDDGIDEWYEASSARPTKRRYASLT